MIKEIIAIYAGTFDPITLGHFEVIRAAHKSFNKLIIALPVKSNKNCLFSIEERLLMISNSLCEEKIMDVSVIKFDGLLVDFATRSGASIIVRGVRNIRDYQYELDLANINKELSKHIQTVLFPASSQESSISSTVVKEIARLNGDYGKFVTSCVYHALYQKMKS